MLYLVLRSVLRDRIDTSTRSQTAGEHDVRVIEVHRVRCLVIYMKRIGERGSLFHRLRG